MKAATRKITVMLPEPLLERLDEVVPARKRSYFIAEAIQEQLTLIEQVAVLDETAGAWREENHPEMQTDVDIDRWLEQLRGSWSPSEESDE